MKINFEKINTGDLGVFVDTLHRHVESNKESILIQLLTCFGNCIGRSAYFTAAADKHYTNLFTVIVGLSSRGRKGQSLNMVKSLFAEAVPDWADKRIKKGLSSGEGLIYHIRDDIQTEDTPHQVFDRSEYSSDKRLLVTESEFSSVLKMTSREGNILSQVLRDAWDSVPLETLTKNNPLKVKEPMISLIGHITIAELTKFLNSTEIANGLGNRCIFIKGASDKKLPNPEPIDESLKKYLVDHLKIAAEKAQKIQKIDFDNESEKYWIQLYNNLSNNDSSIVGTLTARQEAQIRRLAMIIALFNGKNVIDIDSLVFAEEIFEYSIKTLREIYGNSTGDTLTDKIIDLLKASQGGISRSNLSEKLHKNYPKGSLDRSLNILKMQNLVRSESQQNPSGRPTEIFYYNY